MIVFILYYLIGPLAIIYAVQWFFKKYGRTPLPPAIARLYEENPIAPKHFRLIRRDAPAAEPLFIQDFEHQADAVDAMYAARAQARAEAPSAHPAFFVLNDKGEFLEEIDAD